MKRYSKELENQIIEAYKETKNLETVAKKFDKTRTSISRVLKRNNIKIIKKVGKDRHNWKGSKASYSTLHDWVRRWKEKPDTCTLCNKPKRLEVHNIDGLYKRNLEDWIWTCRKCHQTLDGRITNKDSKGRWKIIKNEPMKKGSIIL